MTHMCIKLVLAVLFSSKPISAIEADPVINVSSPETRTRTVNTVPNISQFQANNQPQRQIYHTNVNQNRIPQTSEVEKPRSNNITFSEFMEALKGPQHLENKETRLIQSGWNLGEIERANENPGYHSYSPPSPTLYGYTRPTYAPAPAYHSLPPAAPPIAQSKTSVVKPDILNLLHPIKTKFADKLSGLLGIILPLLTLSVPDGQGLPGIKNILIDGILKPLLIAQGGIKALVSKLVIPVLALVLINVEVLVVIWWLWEECPEKTPQPLLPPTQNYSENPAYSSYPSYK